MPHVKTVDTLLSGTRILDVQIAAMLLLLIPSQFSAIMHNVVLLIAHSCYQFEVRNPRHR